jgi:hypothetical protein
MFVEVVALRYNVNLVTCNRSSILIVLTPCCGVKKYFFCRICVSGWAGWWLQGKKTKCNFFCQTNF